MLSLFKEEQHTSPSQFVPGPQVYTCDFTAIHTGKLSLNMGLQAGARRNAHREPNVAVADIIDLASEGSGDESPSARPPAGPQKRLVRLPAMPSSSQHRYVAALLCPKICRDRVLA